MRPLLLGAFMAGTLSWPAFAVSPSMEALVRSSNVPFQGTLVINGQTVVKVVHGAGDRRRQEILAPMRMKGDLIVDNGKTLWHFSPRTQKVDLSPTRQWGDRVADRIRLLTQNYRMNVLGREKVAGRAVHVVELLPTHGSRSSQRLWLDQMHAVPLRLERLSPQGKLLERTEFRDIDFLDQVDPELFLLELPQNVAVTTSVRLLAAGRTLGDLGDQVPFAVKLPSYLPRGFEGMDVQLFESKGVKSLHWRLSDGLTTLSLFMTGKDHQPVMPSSRTIDLAPKQKAHLLEHPGRRTLCWTADRVSYAMVGDLNEDELLKIARSTVLDD
ncbi:Sigma-E factor regulatory protein RseB precursor [compost metagenome]